MTNSPVVNGRITRYSYEAQWREASYESPTIRTIEWVSNGSGCCKIVRNGNISMDISKAQMWSRLTGKKLKGKIETLERPVGEKESVAVAAEDRLEMGKSGVTFAVDSVTPAGIPIWTETLEDSLNRRFRRKILILPEQQ